MSRAIPDPIPAPGSQAGIHFSTAMFAQNFLGFFGKCSSQTRPDPAWSEVQHFLSHRNKTGVISFSQSFTTFPQFYFGVDFPEGTKLCNPFLPTAISSRRDEGLGRGDGSVLSSGDHPTPYTWP